MCVLSVMSIISDVSVSNMSTTINNIYKQFPNLMSTQVFKIQEHRFLSLKYFFTIERDDLPTYASNCCNSEMFKYNKMIYCYDCGDVVCNNAFKKFNAEDNLIACCSKSRVVPILIRGKLLDTCLNCWAFPLHKEDMEMAQLFKNNRLKFHHSIYPVLIYENISKTRGICDAFVYGVKYNRTLNVRRHASLDMIEGRKDYFAQHRHWHPYFK